MPEFCGRQETLPFRRVYNDKLASQLKFPVNAFYATAIDTPLRINNRKFPRKLRFWMPHNTRECAIVCVWESQIYSVDEENRLEII